MKEDNTQYFNDEWNTENIKKYQKLYDILYVKINNLLEKEIAKDWENGITHLPKEFNNKNNKPDGRRYKK